MNRSNWRARSLLGVLGLGVALAGVAATEGLLAVLGVGRSLDFFVPIPGAAAWGTNPRFPELYFAPSYAIQPDPVFISDPKSPGSFRVFVLGGSAAFGDVAPEYAFGRSLQVMLRARFPGLPVQVVNAALPGIDSQAVRTIASEALTRGADCLVIYMGNNEVVGPHGPATLIEGMAGAGGGAGLGLGRWLRRLRIAQSLDLLTEAGRARLAPPAPEPLDPARYLRTQLAADDPRLESVYARFRDNLEAILAAARDAGVPVVLSTVASNLADWPPLASRHRSDLSADELRAFDRAWDEASEREQIGDPRVLLEVYRRAESIDDRHAALQFRMASALKNAGSLDEAREHFVRARDLDAQRYRADSRINDTIRSVGGGRSDQGVFLVDMERAFASHAVDPVGLPGGDFFYDHAHLNFAGNHAVASILQRAVAAIASHRLSIEASADARVPSPRQVASRLVFGDWDRVRVDHRITANFQNPLLAGREPAAFDTRNRRTGDWSQAGYRARIQGEAAELYGAAMERWPMDLHIRRNAASLLVDMARFELAATQLELLLDRVPNVVEWRTTLGAIQLQRGEVQQAIQALEQALQVDPRNVAARVALGDARLAAGDPEGAVRSYRRALRIHPYLIEARARLAFLLFDQERYEESIPQLEALVRMDPAATRARERLREAILRSGGPTLALEDD